MAETHKLTVDEREKLIEPIAEVAATIRLHRGTKHGMKGDCMYNLRKLGWRKVLCFR